VHFIVQFVGSKLFIYVSRKICNIKIKVEYIFCGNSITKTIQIALVNPGVTEWCGVLLTVCLLLVSRDTV
jgi:hypothetical protein